MSDRVDQGQLIGSPEHVKRKKRDLHQRYEWAHIANDFALAAWFLAGSIMFFSPNLQTPAIWFFVIGSAQMMLGPLIRIAHKLHIQVLGDFDL